MMIWQTKRDKRGQAKTLLDTLFRIKRFYGRPAGIVLPETWATIVGDGIAEHTRPLKISKKMLYIAVDNSAWMSELRLFEADLLAKCSKALGKGKIEKLKFILLPFGKFHEASEADEAEIELDALDEAKIEEVAKAADDPELEAVIRRAYRKSLILKKQDALKRGR